MWAKIALIDDDLDLVELSEHILQSHGYAVVSAANGADGLALVAREAPDLVLLDLMLPDQSGFELCRQLRGDPRFAEIPIIIITGRNSESDLVLGLGLGADDYVVKPFGAAELAARVNAVLRRSRKGEGSSPGRIAHDRLLLDANRHKVQVDGEPVELTATEFRLLHQLAANPGQVLSRPQLIRQAIAQQVVERTVDVHIRAIRRKLKDCAHLIETVRGIGYRFKED